MKRVHFVMPGSYSFDALREANKIPHSTATFRKVLRKHTSGRILGIDRIRYWPGAEVNNETGIP